MVQYGIVSFGRKYCGVQEKSPGVYTKVSKYLTWILDNMQWDKEILPQTKIDNNKISYTKGVIQGRLSQHKGDSLWYNFSIDVHKRGRRKIKEKENFFQEKNFPFMILEKASMNVCPEVRERYGKRLEHKGYFEDIGICDKDHKFNKNDIPWLHFFLFPLESFSITPFHSFTMIRSIFESEYFQKYILMKTSQHKFISMPIWE